MKSNKLTLALRSERQPCPSNAVLTLKFVLSDVVKRHSKYSSSYVLFEILVYTYYSMILTMYDRK